MQEDPPRIVRIHHVFRQGSGAPALVETESGETFVLKLKGAGGGERGLVRELLGLEIAALLGVRVPSARPLFLRADFPWQVGTDEFDAMVQRSASWNLGIAWIADASEVKGDGLDALPEDFAALLAQADALLANVDRPRGNPNILRDASGTHWAIDYEACLFLDRILGGNTDRPSALPVTHFLAGSRYDVPPSARLAAAELRTVLDGVPEDWLRDLPIGRDEIGSRLVRYFAG